MRTKSRSGEDLCEAGSPRFVDDYSLHGRGWRFADVRLGAEEVTNTVTEGRRVPAGHRRTGGRFVQEADGCGEGRPARSSRRQQRVDDPATTAAVTLLTPPESRRISDSRLNIDLRKQGLLVHLTGEYGKTFCCIAGQSLCGLRRPQGGWAPGSRRTCAHPGEGGGQPVCEEAICETYVHKHGSGSCGQQPQSRRPPPSSGRAAPA